MVTLQNLLVLGGVFLAGLTGAALAGRTRYIPRITGIIAVGALLGPYGLGVFSAEMLKASRGLVDVALGLILFQMGLLLDLRTLSRNRWLLLSSAAENSLCFALIMAAMMLCGLNAITAALVAAIGVSSSPAVLISVVRQLNAKGPITERALNLVALNNVLAFFIFTALLPAWHQAHRIPLVQSLLLPAVALIATIGLALTMAWGLIQTSRYLLKPGDDYFALTVAWVLIAVGLSKQLGLSPLLTLMLMGVLVRNLQTPEALETVQFGKGGELFLVALFVQAGANLHLAELKTAGLAAAAFVIARIAGKLCGVLWVSRLEGWQPRRALYLGLTLTPMAAMAIGLTEAAQTLYPESAARLVTIMFAALAILETIGPIATEYALKRAGEVDAKAEIGH